MTRGNLDTDDFSRLTSLRLMTGDLEREAVQVYISRATAEARDQVFLTIAHHFRAALQGVRKMRMAAGECPPGFCPTPDGCVECSPDDFKVTTLLGTFLPNAPDLPDPPRATNPGDIRRP